MIVAQGSQPVIPNFGAGDTCVRDNGAFCWSWVKDNWSDVLWPALREHVVLTLIAVVVGFAIAFTLALITHRRGWLEQPVSITSQVLATRGRIPSPSPPSTRHTGPLRSTVQGLEPFSEVAP